MPIYEYVCRACGARFEKRRAMADADAPLACPHCGAEDTRRALSLFFTSGGSQTGSSPSQAGGGCASCSSHSCSTCSH